MASKDRFGMAITPRVQTNVAAGGSSRATMVVACSKLRVAGPRRLTARRSAVHHSAGFLCVALLMALPGAVRADMTTFTVDVRADYEFSLLGGTPLNPGPTTPFVPFRAIGDLTFKLDPSINNASATTVPFTDVTGVLHGVPPSPAATLPHTISPNLQFLGGELTNIVRNGTGNVVSADVTDLSMRWVLVGMSPSFPVTLYTQVGLPFDARGVSIPFTSGTALEGGAPFNVYLDTGAGNPANDPLVAIGENRTLTATPEPTSFALGALGAAGLVVHRLRPARTKLRRPKVPRPVDFA